MDQSSSKLRLPPTDFFYQRFLKSSARINDQVRVQHMVLEFQVGDIFVTRNAGDETENPSPGYWNHIAVAVVNGVVEAQLDPGQVIFSDSVEFVSRYPEIRVYRPKNMTKSKALDMSKEAVMLLGTPYSRFGSLKFLFWVKGVNCVKVARKAYELTFGVDPGWELPDDITEDVRLELIDEKK